jgi:hypothetical protein
MAAALIGEHSRDTLSQRLGSGPGDDGSREGHLTLGVPFQGLHQGRPVGLAQLLKDRPGAFKELPGAAALDPPDTADHDDGGEPGQRPSGAC